MDNSSESLSDNGYLMQLHELFASALSTPGFMEWATFVLLVLGFLVTFLQLRSVIHQHKENHEWSRRKAAEDVCTNYAGDISFRILLETYLDWSERTEPIPYEEIRSIGEQADLAQAHVVEDIAAEAGKAPVSTHPSDKPSARIAAAIHRQLNYYESFSRGIDEGVYDEKIIKRAFFGQMRHSLYILMPYITERRKMNPKVWEDFEQLVNDWKLAEKEKAKRAKTGQ